MKVIRSISVLFVGLVIGVALFATMHFSAKGAFENETHAKLWPAMNDNINQAADDTDAFVLLAGGSEAQRMNAEIPLLMGQTFKLAKYSPIAKGTTHYATALQCMTEAIYYEAGNESREGKLAVAQVVLNRMRHRAFPNSVCGVVYQGVNEPVCQFSFTCDGSLLDAPVVEVWEAAEKVAVEALAGKQLASVGTSTHYHADYVVPKWAYSLGKLKVIGTHIFYRMPGAIGDPSAFTAKWARAENIPTINWASADVEPEAMIELAALQESEEPIEEDPLTPGLTVVPDKTDRHAANDVGGRLDTTKQWRLSIPDPVSSESQYDTAVQSQGAGSAAQ